MHSYNVHCVCRSVYVCVCVCESLFVRATLNMRRCVSACVRVYALVILWNGSFVHISPAGWLLTAHEHIQDEKYG